MVENSVYGVWKLGENYASASCEEGFSRYGWLRCVGAFGAGTFSLNSLTKRFQFYTPGQYVNATLDYEKDIEPLKLILKPDTGGDTPVIEIGTCGEI